jgi:hypothetical protein
LAVPAAPFSPCEAAGSLLASDPAKGIPMVIGGGVIVVVVAVPVVIMVSKRDK